MVVDCEVLDVQTTPKETEVSFGTTTAGFMILAGPAVQVTLHQEIPGHQQSRECFMSLAQTPRKSPTIAGEGEDYERGLSLELGSQGTGWQPFQLDVSAAVDNLQAVCIAIEKWHPRINSGQGTCLVIQAVSGEASYSRLEVSFGPASWVQVARRTEVKIA
ncbi:hypothetical protein PV08_00353 [Exophiala spinifera]|uniref:Uncharacterized protein n=1 Tax=Exophiala spinifera TaxID=91928 RepID=A0A0D2BLF0_9EURO|nr:uncharacterized protein PV08_00353 [Exophiala spinifera]KIW19778.1 hypothetical protein PV08_00353 [Exophiala spinifera]